MDDNLKKYIGAKIATMNCNEKGIIIGIADFEHSGILFLIQHDDYFSGHSGGTHKDIIDSYGIIRTKKNNCWWYKRNKFNIIEMTSKREQFRYELLKKVI